MQKRNEANALPAKRDYQQATHKLCVQIGGTTVEKNKKRIINLIIGVLLLFIVGVAVPTWGPVTRLGVQAISIFIGLVYLAVTGFSFVFAGTIAMFAMQLTGFFTGSSIIAQSWGGSTIYQLILVYALCQGLVECGAGDVIARYLISRKWAQGKPLAFTFMLLMASIFAGAFLGLGGIVFYYSILDEIRKNLQYEENSEWMKYNVFGVYVAACIGMSLIPYKGIPLIVFSSLNAMLVQYGLELNLVTYMLGIAVFGVLASIVYCLLLKYVFRVDMSRLSNFDIRKMEGMADVRMNKHQAIVSIIFAISILYGVAIVFIPKSTEFYTFFSGITQTTNPRTALKNGVSWEILFSIAAFSLIGSMVSSADTGIQTWIREVFGGVLGSMSYPVFFLVIMVVALILTNLMSNVAIGIMISTVAVPFLAVFAADSGINITMFTAGLMMADMYAFATPAACGFLARSALRTIPSSSIPRAQSSVWCICFSCGECLPSHRTSFD